MKYEEEIKALFKKARRSLKAAESLLSEGNYDFAISRAYYSMFYCAEAILLTKDMKFKKHSAVISMFGKEFIKKRILPEKLHQYLISAFKERGKGDYESLFLQTEEEAKEILENAEEFISEIKNFLSNLGYKLKKAGEK